MTISQFDPYVIETWVDCGLSVAIPERTATGDQESRASRFLKAFSVKSVLKASVVATGMVLTSLSFVTSSSAVADALKVTEALEYYEPTADEVPPGRWPKLVAMLRANAELPADDTNGDPAPLG